MDRWITDTEISTRFPYYTRANADEVGPEPFTPLGWSLGWMKGCVPGVAEGYVRFGVLEHTEFAVDPPEVFGNWGGYFYNQLSLPRIMGVRMPGASPEAIDDAYFGDHPGIPLYTADPRDENESQSAKLAETMAWVMSADAFPAQDEVADQARAAVASRPDLTTLSHAELVARARAMTSLLDVVWVQYCQACLGSSLGPGAVAAVCAAVDRSDDAIALMSAVGDIESAGASFSLWELARTVKRSAMLMGEFDRGVNGLLDRLAGSSDADAAAFLAGWAELLAEYGHRGPNEWDMGAPSWTTKPTLALGMLERLRNQDDARDPKVAQAQAAVERERLVAELTELTAGDPDAQALLVAGVKSAALFFSSRERGKSASIRTLHEAKLAMLELGRRHTAAGNLDEPDQIFYLVDDELDGFLTDPTGRQPALRERQEGLALLATLEPPYIVKLEEGCPPISTWKPRHADNGAKSVDVGDVLQGAAGAPGQVTGVARILLDPSDAFTLEPGDIIVAATTDPSWTPLFLAAGGVIVNVGAVASHAAIVSRELGVPCVLSVVDATRRIPDGAMVELDGNTGRVTIVALAMTTGPLNLDGDTDAVADTDTVAGVAGNDADVIDLDRFDLLDPATQQCPHPHYARMREVAPVLATRAGDLPVWLVTRHDMILDIVRDTETYSSQFGGAAIPADPELAARLRQMRDEAGAWPAVGTLLTADPPAHTRFRKLVSKAFTARAIADLEPVIRDICRRLIASFIDDGRIELMARFAVPLPVEVIAHALAVPPDRLADFKRWSDDAVAAIGASLSPEQRCDAELGIIELQHYFAEQLERRRIEPGPDVLSNLVHARIDTDEDPDVPDEPLSMAEMLSILQQLLVAGNETTTKLLTEMMRLLGEHPDRWQQLRADPSRVKDVVEECLRLSTPSQAMWRIATRDVVLDGVPIPTGGRVVVMYSSANRDERVFANGDAFDPDRPNLGSHVAFGKGTHFCVGAALSRLEARIALEELTAAIASFSLAETNTFTYLPSFMLRGLTRLDLDVVPA